MALTEAQKRNAEKNRQYWADREAEALKHYIKDEAEYDKQIQKIYADMLDDIQTQINGFYGKYAAREGISLAEAKKRVSQLDIEAYERKAKRYVKDKDFSAKANEEMRLYNATMKINRLEMLKANIGLETIAGHNELEKFMAKILRGRTEAELARQAGILGKTIHGNSKLAHAIPNASFHSGTFSDRIWQYQDLMRGDLEKLLTRGLIQGKNARALTADLRKYLIGDKNGKGATYNVERLMRTELARVQTEAQKQAFIRNGFTQYQFHTNSGCCAICQGLNGKVFDVDKMMPGDNAPPVHPHCRCSTSAYSDRKEYDEWLDFLANGGTTEEWNKKKQQLTKSSKSDTIQMLADINKMLTPYERMVLDSVPKKDGYFDFAAHGTPKSVLYDNKNKNMSARELARVIEHDDKYHGEKVRLLSCSTGAIDEGFAQQLANALGVEVEAPTDVLLVYPNGKIKIGYDGSGKMKTFKPHGRK